MVPDSDKASWIFSHVQSDVTRTIHARNGKHLFARPSDKRGDATKRALVRLMEARTRGAHTWVSCQNLSPSETMDPEL